MEFILFQTFIHIPEYALKKKVRWVMNSQQGKRYIKHRIGDELKHKILETQRDKDSPTTTGSLENLWPLWLCEQVREQILREGRL